MQETRRGQERCTDRSGVAFRPHNLNVVCLLLTKATFAGMEGTQSLPPTPTPRHHPGFLSWNWGKLEEQLMNSDLLRGVARAQPMTQDEPHVPFVPCLECDPTISTACSGWEVHLEFSEMSTLHFPLGA